MHILRSVRSVRSVRSLRLSRVVSAFALAVVAVGRTGFAASAAYADLHNFSFGLTDGSSPFGGVVIYNSKIYGTTSLWGSGEEGVLYTANLNGSGYQVLQNFSGVNGVQPSADLVVSGTKLFGTAEFGGGGSGADMGLFSATTPVARVFKTFISLPVRSMMRERRRRVLPLSGRRCIQPLGKGGAVMVDRSSA
jgi:hypothetical protein